MMRVVTHVHSTFQTNAQTTGLTKLLDLSNLNHKHIVEMESQRFGKSFTNK